MCKFNPDYNQHVRYESEKKGLYLLVLRSIYGWIDSEFLWYKILSTKFEGLDFEINPYDRCVAKKIIEGTKCTMAWYADDNKMSHKNPAVISDIINIVKEDFGDLFFW